MPTSRLILNGRLLPTCPNYGPVHNMQLESDHQPKMELMHYSLLYERPLHAKRPLLFTNMHSPDSLTRTLYTVRTTTSCQKALSCSLPWLIQIHWREHCAQHEYYKRDFMLGKSNSSRNSNSIQVCLHYVATWFKASSKIKAKCTNWGDISLVFSWYYLLCLNVG